MSPLEFALTLFGVSLGAGFLGSLVGLGGGIIVVPALTLLFGIDIRGLLHGRWLYLIFGLVLMWLAGIFSGLLGLGSGTLKVSAMDMAILNGWMC